VFPSSRSSENDGSDQSTDTDFWFRCLLECPSGSNSRTAWLAAVCFCGAAAPAHVLAVAICATERRSDAAFIAYASDSARRAGGTRVRSRGSECISGGLYQEIQNWLIVRSSTCKANVQGSPFLFPTNRGTSFRIGNYLKRHLKPLALRAGIPDFTFQAMRRTCATHFQRHGNPKDAQAQLRHSRLSMTGLYMKEIPEQVKAAVESLDAALCSDVHRPIN